MNQAVDITGLLEAINSGDEDALNDLFQLVHAELHQLAHAQRRRWTGDETLNTTALINEAYLKLAGQRSSAFNDRGHFYSTAAKAMRHILVNYAEKQRAAKRGGNQVKVPLDDLLLVDHDGALELLAINRALESLEQEHPRRAKVFECRVFGGMSNQETADALQISLATVKRHWRITTAAFYRQLNSGDVAT